MSRFRKFSLFFDNYTLIFLCTEWWDKSIGIENIWMLFKICNLQCAITDFFGKQPRVLFTLIDPSHYYVYKSIKVQLPKNK